MRKFNFADVLIGVICDVQAVWRRLSTPRIESSPGSNERRMMVMPIEFGI
jgi:hypothetical protein